MRGRPRAGPGIGLLQFRLEVLNQRDETRHEPDELDHVRPARPSLASGAGRPAEACSGRRRSGAERRRASPRGPRVTSKRCRSAKRPSSAPTASTPDAIMRFAKTYDPQPFHVDPEAARRSLFGGLCASGWHTAAIWMKLDGRAARCGIRRGRATRPATVSPRPLARLQEHELVEAGLCRRHRHVPLRRHGSRPSKSRPGWGLASHRNSGANQHGEEVFSFEGTVFWERRGATA